MVRCVLSVGVSAKEGRTSPPASSRRRRNGARAGPFDSGDEGEGEGEDDVILWWLIASVYVLPCLNVEGVKPKKSRSGSIVNRGVPRFSLPPRVVGLGRKKTGRDPWGGRRAGTLERG